MNLQALVDGVTEKPQDVSGLWDAYKQYVSRSRAERLKLKRELEIAGCGTVINTRDLFRMPEAWHDDGFPAVAISHYCAGSVQFISVYDEPVRLRSETRWSVHAIKTGRPVFRSVPPVPRMGGLPLYPPDRWAEIAKRDFIRAQRRASIATPPVPKALMPFSPMVRRRSFVLFDAPSWEDKQVLPVDPYLLERLSDDRFRVVAHWDLTPKELQIMALLR